MKKGAKKVAEEPIEETPEEKTAREIAENTAWVESTNVWLGDFVIGSADFWWEDTHIQVEPPPDLEFRTVKGVLTVVPASAEGYMTWAIAKLGFDLASRIQFTPYQEGLPIQHWRLAKEIAFMNANNQRRPNFIPPHPLVSGGRTRAAIF